MTDIKILVVCFIFSLKVQFILLHVTGDVGVFCCGVMKWVELKVDLRVPVKPADRHQPTAAGYVASFLS